MTSTLKTNAIEPEGGTTNMVVGESGQNTVIGNNDIRANVLQDAGGNALFTSNGSGVLSGVNSGLGNTMVLLSTQTASNSSGVAFTSGIDSTYSEYIFKFYNLADHANQLMHFQVNASGQSGYNETITSTAFFARHTEGGTTGLSYRTSADQAQGTAYQVMSEALRADADASMSGELHLFNPASTTYVKHFYLKTSVMQSSPGAWGTYVAGYINTTAAITQINFKTDSGTFDGKIKMWGVK